MDTVQEKIAYLKGLIAGSDFLSQDATARNVWHQLMEVVDELGREVTDLRALQEEMEQYIDAIDDDLAEMQEDVYGADFVDADEQGEWLGVVCPHCGNELIYEDGSVYGEGGVSCPNCGQVVYYDEDDTGGEYAEQPETGHAQAGVERPEETRFQGVTVE